MPRAERPDGCIVEIFPVFLRASRIFWLRLDGQPGWHAPAPFSAHPHDTVLTELARLGGGPFLVHSTSWRHEPGRLMLTYLAVLPELHQEVAGFTAREAPRAALARGRAEEAPARISAEQVLEHALRHLAWLSRDDPAVQYALGPGWTRALSSYLPRPFSSLDMVSSSLA